MSEIMYFYYCRYTNVNCFRSHLPRSQRHILYYTIILYFLLTLYYDLHNSIIYITRDIVNYYVDYKVSPPDPGGSNWEDLSRPNEVRAMM